MWVFYATIIHRVTVTSLWLQQLPPPCCRYNLWQQCNVVNVSVRLHTVSYGIIHGLRIILAREFADFYTLAYYLFTLRIPPTWRSGFQWRRCTSCVNVLLIKHTYHKTVKSATELSGGDKVIRNPNSRQWNARTKHRETRNMRHPKTEKKLRVLQRAPLGRRLWGRPADAPVLSQCPAWLLTVGLDWEVDLVAAHLWP